MQSPHIHAIKTELGVITPVLYKDANGNSNVIWQKGNAKEIKTDGLVYKNIGVEYWQKQNDHTSYCYTQNKLTAIYTEAASSKNWVSQMPNGKIIMQCLKACELMLKSKGVTPYGSNFAIATANNNGKGSVGTVSKSATKAYNIMNNELSKGHPVIVGVDYKPGNPGNADKMTDHFIVVVSMLEFYDNDKWSRSYNFYDPGKIHSNAS